MRPFFSRKLWESVFLLTLQNIFRTGSVHWNGLFFLLFCFVLPVWIWQAMTAQSNWAVSWIWGHFVQIHHVSGAAVFLQLINTGILDSVRPKKKESHCSLSHDFATSSQITDVASKEAKQLFLTKLCSWCPISYQNNWPVPWGGKIPWERSYSKAHTYTEPKTCKQTKPKTTTNQNQKQKSTNKQQQQKT